MIVHLKGSLYLLRLTDEPDLHPLGNPIVDSLLRIYECEAGYLLESIVTPHLGGYYLSALRTKSLTREVDVAFKSKELVVLDVPGRVTVAISPIVNEQIQRILDKQ